MEFPLSLLPSGENNLFFPHHIFKSSIQNKRVNIMSGGRGGGGGLISFCFVFLYLNIYNYLEGAYSFVKINYFVDPCFPILGMAPMDCSLPIEISKILDAHLDLN